MKTAREKTELKEIDDAKHNVIILKWKAILEDATLPESWPCDPDVFCTLKDDIVEYFRQEGSMKCLGNDCILWKDDRG